MMDDDDGVPLSSSDDDDDRRDTDSPAESSQPESSSRTGSSFPVPRTRTALLSNQKTKLMALWQETHFPSSTQRLELSADINLPPRKVQVWFQNMRQKLRRAEKDAGVNIEEAQPQRSAARSTSVSSSQRSAHRAGSPSSPPRRRSTAPRHAPRATVLPSISSFMLTHAPAPTLMLGNAPTWAIPSSSVSPYAPHMSRPISYAPVAGGSPATGWPAGPSTSSVPQSARYSPPSATSHYHPEPPPPPPPLIPSSSASTSVRLPSFSDLIRSNSGSSTDTMGVRTPPADDLSFDRSWSAAHQNAPPAIHPYFADDAPGPAPLPTMYPHSGQKSLSQSAPSVGTFSTTPSPRSVAKQAYPLPAMSALSVHPSHGRSGSPDNPAKLDLSAAVPAHGSWEALDSRTSPRSASMGEMRVPSIEHKRSPRSASMSEAEAPRFGVMGLRQRPPDNLEVVGTGGKAGLGRWCIAQYAGSSNRP